MIIYNLPTEEPLVVGKYGTSVEYTSFTDYCNKMKQSFLHTCLINCFYGACLYDCANSRVINSNQFGMSNTVYNCLIARGWCSTNAKTVQVHTGFLGALQVGNYQCCAAGGYYSMGYSSATHGLFNNIFFNNKKNFLMCVILCLNNYCEFPFGGMCVPASVGTYGFCIYKNDTHCGICRGTCCYTNSSFYWYYGSYSHLNLQFYPTQLCMIDGNVKFLTEFCL